MYVGVCGLLHSCGCCSGNGGSCSVSGCDGSNVVVVVMVVVMVVVVVLVVVMVAMWW